MGKKIIWTMACFLMVVSLIIASCGTEDTGGTVTTVDKGQTVTVGTEEDKIEEKEEIIEISSDEPQYGGTITLAAPVNDITWNLLGLGKAAPHQLSHNRLWRSEEHTSELQSRLPLVIPPLLQ